MRRSAYVPQPGSRAPGSRCPRPRVAGSNHGRGKAVRAPARSEEARCPPLLRPAHLPASSGTAARNCLRRRAAGDEPGDDFAPGPGAPHPGRARASRASVGGPWHSGGRTHRRCSYSSGSASGEALVPARTWASALFWGDRAPVGTPQRGGAPERPAAPTRRRPPDHHRPRTRWPPATRRRSGTGPGGRGGRSAAAPPAC